MDCERIRFRGGTASSQRFEQLLQLCAHGTIFLRAQIATQLHGHIKCAYPRTSNTKDFTDKTLGAVAVNGPGGGFFSSDHTEPRMERRVGPRARNEVAAGHSYTGLQNSLEFARPS